MKSFKIENDDWFCLGEDAIFYENNFYSRIKGDYENGFSIELPKKIKNIDDDDWVCLEPSLETQNGKYHIFSGETSWGGTGFIAVKCLKTNSFKWILHLSTMNNPVKVSLKDDIIHLITDLNYPHGVEFIIPIENPEKFQIKKLGSIL